MARCDVECAPAQNDSDGADTQPKMGVVDLEQLGRQRPDVFPNAVYEVMFCSSLLISMLMAVGRPNPCSHKVLHCDRNPLTPI